MVFSKLMTIILFQSEAIDVSENSILLSFGDQKNSLRFTEKILWLM